MTDALAVTPVVTRIDGLTIKVRSWATVCPVCIRAAFNGAQHATRSLLCDGWMHALTPDERETLCHLSTAPQSPRATMSGETPT